jgi:hypothetical protein
MPPPKSIGKCCPKYTLEYAQMNAYIIPIAKVHFVGNKYTVNKNKVKAVAV